jgi:hypothetical protein
MKEEKKQQAKKKIGEIGTGILTETRINANDRPQIMAQIDDLHETKGDESMAGEKMENQGMKWQEMMMGMWNNIPAFASSSKTMEPFVELMKMQQQQGVTISQSWLDCFRKIGEASRSGDAKKVWETCMELNSDLFKTCQESMKEQAKARYEFLRAFVPAPGFTGGRT